MEANDFCVLIAEDDAILRYATSRILVSSGYKVLCAGDGLEALEFADSRTGPIHLLLTDLTLPKISGVEVTRALKTRYPDLSVMFASGADASEVPADIRRYSQYFTKPVRNDAIRDAAAEIYGRVSRNDIF